MFKVEGSLLKPAVEHLAEKPRPADVVKGILDPQTASEALESNGLIPQGFFQDPGRAFDASGNFSGKPTSFPKRVSQVVEIANNLQEFQRAELLARETGEAVAQINKWWIEQDPEGFREIARDKSTRQLYLAAPSNFVLWRDKVHYSNRRADVTASSVWAGWELISATLRGAGFDYIGTVDQIEEASAAWDGGECFLRDARSTRGWLLNEGWLRKVLAAYLQKNPEGYPLKNFRNPLKPLLVMMKETRHGMVEMIALKKDITGLSIGYNLW